LTLPKTITHLWGEDLKDDHKEGIVKKETVQKPQKPKQKKSCWENPTLTPRREGREKGGGKIVQGKYERKKVVIGLFQ